MNRILAAVITVFWGVMWTLLLRTELQPQKTALREVPLEHVLKLLFQHQQQSDLFLSGDGLRIGHVTLKPHIPAEGELRLLDFNGNAQLRFPGAARQNVDWNGTVTFNPALTLQRVDLSVRFRDSTMQTVPTSALECEFDPLAKTATYRIWNDGRLIDTQNFTLDKEGVQRLMDHAGLDMNLLQSLSLQSGESTARMTAHQSSILLKEEKVETLLVSAEVNGQTLLEFHVSQLGQILRAKTITGWTLDSD